MLFPLELRRSTRSDQKRADQQFPDLHGGIVHSCL
jgi:hypothetical protein